MFRLAHRAGVAVVHATRQLTIKPAVTTRLRWQSTQVQASGSLREQFKTAEEYESFKKMYGVTAAEESDPSLGLEERDALYFRTLKTSDMWLTRQVFSEIAGEDSVPDPKVIVAGLAACRRLNDYALAIRFLENCHHKTIGQDKNLWAYIVQEITPAMQTLGISSLEEMGYDKPEMEVIDVFDMYKK